MPRDCETLGHTKMGQDELCVTCDQVLNAKSFIGRYIPAPPADRAFDELPEDSVASPADWGDLHGFRNPPVAGQGTSPDTARP